MSNKLKAVRIKYREAVDSGRRSSHGRIVMLYYELCTSIWGGSPAMNPINGVESSDISLQQKMLQYHNKWRMMLMI